MIKLFKIIIIIIFFSKISFAESIKETDKYSIKFKKNLIHDIDNSIKEQTINSVVEISKLDLMGIKNILIKISLKGWIKII